MNEKLNLKKSSIAGLLAGAASGVINAVLFLVFHGAGVISDDIYMKPNEPMTLMPVLMASIIPSVIGGFVFFLFEKYTKKGLKIFSILSLTLMALSLISPFTVIPRVTVGYSLVLCIMHIVVALSLLYFIRKAKQTKQLNPSFQTI